MSRSEVSGKADKGIVKKIVKGPDGREVVSWTASDDFGAAVQGTTPDSLSTNFVMSASSEWSAAIQKAAEVMGVSTEDYLALMSGMVP